MSTILEPNVLQWARLRAGMTQSALAKEIKVPLEKVAEWEATGAIDPALIELLAENTRTPLGFLLLKAPPQERLPIPDFRRLPASGTTAAPSAHLLTVIRDAKLKQNWYREYITETTNTALPFVGKASLKSTTKTTAADIRNTIGIGPSLNVDLTKIEDALKHSIEAVEGAGILVLRSGYAGTYTHNKLSVDEFRGFALVDKFAPLIFINGADAPSAQMFTLAHELAHIWIGESGVSNLEKTYSDWNPVEVYCNAVAAEILVPEDKLATEWNRYFQGNKFSELAKMFKVSRLVIARRAKDSGLITPEQYESIYLEETVKKGGSGGNYHFTYQYKNSKRLSVAIIQDAREGKTLFRDAMQILGMKKLDTFQNYAASLGVRA